MSNNEARNSRTGKKQMTPRERARKKRRNIILIAIEVIVLAVLLLVCFAPGGLFDTLGVDTPFTEKPQDEEGNVAGVNEEIQDMMESEDENPMKDYQLIALFGVDSRDENLSSGDNRSDTIMVAAVNKETKDVKLVSVYRDTFLNVSVEEDDPFYNKCNTAYALGGYTQAVSVLNANLDLYIEDYVTIGFKGLTDVVNSLGGVWIDVDSAEIDHLNNYQYVMSEELGSRYPYVEVTDTGYQLLTGLQATAYCRIRYTAGDDYKRAARQREVIMAVLEQAKVASLPELTSAAKDIFSEVSTSLTLDEIIDLLGIISDYEITEQGGFPEESMRTSGIIGSKGSCVVPVSLASNVAWLHEFLFEDTEYEATSTVQEYSNGIYNEVYKYLGDLVQE